MRKWWISLAVLGAGGLGAYLLSDKGRETARRWWAMVEDVPEQWGEWNDTAQAELERIQTTLNQIAQSLEPSQQAGR